MLILGIAKWLLSLQPCLFCQEKVDSESQGGTSITEVYTKGVVFIDLPKPSLVPLTDIQSIFVPMGRVCFSGAERSWVFTPFSVSGELRSCGSQG